MSRTLNSMYSHDIKHVINKIEYDTNKKIRLLKKIMDKKNGLIYEKINRLEIKVNEKINYYDKWFITINDNIDYNEYKFKLFFYFIIIILYYLLIKDIFC